MSDPRDAPRPPYARWATSLVRDPRDVAFIALMIQCAAVAVAGIAIFFAGPIFWYLVPLYWIVLVFGVLDRFTLMLHCTSHRQLFTAENARLELIIPWVLGPFFGQTPGTYFAHHMGMHHREENLAEDASSTMRFQRDRLTHWLRYWARFMTIGIVDLVRYHLRHRHRRLVRRTIVGETTYFAAVAVLAFVDLRATLAVFVAPLVLMRTLMMMGNWAQHAFVCTEQPDNPYRASITCLNTRYNRRCFNDGYHALHHVKPRCHWTEHPVEYERNVAQYGRQDAIVLDGLDFFQVWLLLMAGRWKSLARAFVRLPGAPERSEEQVIAFLKQRVRAITPSEA